MSTVRDHLHKLLIWDFRYKCEWPLILRSIQIRIIQRLTESPADNYFWFLSSLVFNVCVVAPLSSGTELFSRTCIRYTSLPNRFWSSECLIGITRQVVKLVPCQSHQVTVRESVYYTTVRYTLLSLFIALFENQFSLTFAWKEVQTL